MAIIERRRELLGGKKAYTIYLPTSLPDEKKPWSSTTWIPTHVGRVSFDGEEHRNAGIYTPINTSINIYCYYYYVDDEEGHSFYIRYNGIVVASDFSYWSHSISYNFELTHNVKMTMS